MTAMRPRLSGRSSRSGDSLRMPTAGEGVERDEQLAHLRDEGCKEAQGFLIGVPLPAREIPGLLAHFHLGEPQTA